MTQSRRIYAIGLDYGTNSCRALIVNLNDGTETADFVVPYARGEDGVFSDPADPNVARQHPADYLEGLEKVTRGAIARALESDSAFDPSGVIAIGLDATASTPMPVDAVGVPLALHPEFAENLAAMAWLWKDHSSHEEAEEITAKASELRPEYLAKCGGVYSSEWLWSKALHCSRVAPDVFASAHSWVELCDYLPGVLCGVSRTEIIARGVCAAGHKAMYSDQWGGLPDEAFLGEVSSVLASLRGRLFDTARAAGQPAGHLSAEWADRLGLHADVVVAVGGIDAHVGAVGSGIRPGTLVKILGTSTCDMMVHPRNEPLEDIPGVAGIVDGSILPGFYGIEAGQAAVGDLFLWLVNNLTPARYGSTNEERFRSLAHEAQRLEPGESGLLALDWNNGNRNVLGDPQLSGLLVGQSLRTTAHEVYRALIEATAFGSRTIIQRIEEYGVRVEEIVNCGGLATNNPLLLQIYADVIGRPMKVAATGQTVALGAAILGAVAAGPENGGFFSVEEAQERLCPPPEKVVLPDQANRVVYDELFALYRDLHDTFGVGEGTGALDFVMKRLIALRDSVRTGKQL